MLYNILEDFNKEIGKVKTLKEALSFEEDSYNEGDGVNTPEASFNDDIESDKTINNIEKPDVAGKLVDNIRKMALKGMSELADNTDNPSYDILKKVWQLCDKKSDQKKLEGINNNNNN